MVGQLLSNLEYTGETHSINVLDASGTITDSFSCPSTFIKITYKKNSYGLFLKDQVPIVFRDIPKDCLEYHYDKSVKQYSRQCGISHTLVFKLKNKSLEEENAISLFKYVVKNIPQLNKYNKSFKITYGENNTLAITIDISLYYLLPNIINVVEYGLANDKKELPIVYKNNIDSSHTIHIVSELYILVFIILLYIPKMLYFAKPTNNNDSHKVYSHMHLVFSQEEMAKLSSQSIANGYGYIADYIKVVIAKCLSIFIEHHMIVFIDDRSIDYFPIYPHMDNGYLQTLIDKNKKSRLAKGLLTSFIERLVEKKKGYSLPLVLVNLVEIPITDTIELAKISIDNRDSSYPITMAVYYSSEHMVISISYNKDMAKIRYIFNEFVEELLK
jgi:hypothetical protein